METEEYFCVGCGIHYAVTVQALLNNDVLVCEKCGQPLMPLPDPDEQPPIC